MADPIDNSGYVPSPDTNVDVPKNEIPQQQYEGTKSIDELANRLFANDSQARQDFINKVSLQAVNPKTGKYDPKMLHNVGFQISRNRYIPNPANEAIEENRQLAMAYNQAMRDKYDQEQSYVDYQNNLANTNNALLSGRTPSYLTDSRNANVVSPFDMTGVASTIFGPMNMSYIQPNAGIPAYKPMPAYKPDKMVPDNQTYKFGYKENRPSGPRSKGEGFRTYDFVANIAPNRDGIYVYSGGDINNEPFERPDKGGKNHTTATTLNNLLMMEGYHTNLPSDITQKKKAIEDMRQTWKSNNHGTYNAYTPQNTVKEGYKDYIDYAMYKHKFGKDGKQTIFDEIKKSPFLQDPNSPLRIDSSGNMYVKTGASRNPADFNNMLLEAIRHIIGNKANNDLSNINEDKEITNKVLASQIAEALVMNSRIE